MAFDGKTFLFLLFLVSFYGHGIGRGLAPKIGQFRYEVSCVRQERAGGEIEQGCVNLLQERKNRRDALKQRRRQVAGQKNI